MNKDAIRSRVKVTETLYAKYGERACVLWVEKIVDALTDAVNEPSEAREEIKTALGATYGGKKLRVFLDVRSSYSAFARGVFESDTGEVIIFIENLVAFDCRYLRTTLYHEFRHAYIAAQHESNGTYQEALAQNMAANPFLTQEEYSAFVESVNDGLNRVKALSGYVEARDNGAERLTREDSKTLNEWENTINTYYRSIGRLEIKGRHELQNIGQMHADIKANGYSHAELDGEMHFITGLEEGDEYIFVEHQAGNPEYKLRHFVSSVKHQISESGIASNRRAGNSMEYRYTELDTQLRTFFSTEILNVFFPELQLWHNRDLCQARLPGCKTKTSKKPAAKRPTETQPSTQVPYLPHAANELPGQRPAALHAGNQNAYLGVGVACALLGVFVLAYMVYRLCITADAQESKRAVKQKKA